MIDAATEREPTHALKPGVDAWSLMTRHRGIILLCTGASLLLGVTYCLVTPKTYESVAEVLIEEQRSPLFNEQTLQDRPRLQSGIDTHMLVIKSPMILDAAIEAFQLDQLREFADVEADEVVDAFGSKLTVEAPDEDTAILQLRFRAKSPGECRKAVGGVVATYEHHLNAKSAGLGEDISNLIQRGKDELLNQLHEMDQEYTTFQKNAPLLWRDGEGVNIYQERQVEIEKKRQELLVEQAMLNAKITSVEEAIANGGASQEAVYYEALIELHLAEDPDVMAADASKGYSFELAKEYMAVLAQERALREEYGKGHPDLIAVRARLAELSQGLESSLGRSLDAGGVSLAPQEKIARPEYVEIYRRLLSARRKANELQLSTLDDQYARAAASGEEIQVYMAKDAALRTDRERTEELFDAVVARLEEINIIEDYGGETMLVIAPPQTGEVVWPSIPIVGALSIMLGMMIGLIWGTLREMTDRVFHDATEIRNTLGVPVLGQIPRESPQSMAVHPDHENVSPNLGVIHRPQSRFAEAHRGIRTTLYFSTSRRDQRVIQVTSPLPGDGKSSLVANLGASIAHTGKRVIIVDADMRRPTMDQLFGLKNCIGLADCIEARADLSAATQATSVRNLDVLPSGKIPTNPAELLTHDRFRQLLATLKEEYDIVLVDSPPLLAVSDPGVIAPRVDGVIVVLRIRKGVQLTATRTSELLSHVEADVMGVVINAAPASHGGYRESYGYQYQCGYGLGHRETDHYYRRDDRFQRDEQADVENSGSPRKKVLVLNPDHQSVSNPDQPSLG